MKCSTCWDNCRGEYHHSLRRVPVRLLICFSFYLWIQTEEDVRASSMVQWYAALAYTRNRGLSNNLHGAKLRQLSHSRERARFAAGSLPSDLLRDFCITVCFYFLLCLCFFWWWLEVRQPLVRDRREIGREWVSVRERQGDTECLCLAILAWWTLGNSATEQGFKYRKIFYEDMRIRMIRA